MVRILPNGTRETIAKWVLALILSAFPAYCFANATLLPPGKNCFSATVGVSGIIGTLGTITGGSGYVNGTYGGVSLTGGAGSGATATIVVSGGAVTSVTVLNPGTQYVVGNTLSAAAASLGGSGSGFSVPVTATAINGSLAGGTVAMYVPNTTTPKQTWQDAAQTILNTNPVTLDANGCALIYGTGSYRQILSDSLGNLVWDAVTADTSSSNSVFWAGVAGGTPNVITITDPGFNATDGSVINFTALATNTGAATLNPSSFGPIPILKDTTAGPVALTGGEIVASNPIEVIFRASDNAFHLLNTVIASASGATAPLCGASGLKITNDSGTPDTILTITASQAVMQTPSGLVINRSNISQSANITLGTTTATAGGMDGETAGTSAWLYIWLIDNGSAPAALVSAASGHGLSPTMPSGYTYKCLMGSMRVDGSTHLLRTVQNGAATDYNVTAATNTAAYPTIISGTSGTCGVGTMTSASTSSTVPPIATRIKVILNMNATSNAAVAPTNGTGGASVANASPLAYQYPAATFSNTTSEFVLMSSNIFYCSTGPSNLVQAMGWTNAVNAN